MAFLGSLVSAVITYAILVVIASVVTLFAAYLLYIKYTHIKYRHIPGPQRSSFIFDNDVMLKERLEEDAIGKLVGFSMKLDAFDDHCPFPKAISKLLKGVMASMMKPWLWMVPTKEAANFRTEVREAARFIRNAGRDIILERIAARRRGEDVPKDILTHILNASDNLSNQEFGIEEMIDEFLSFFIAGQETTGNTLAFILQQLCRYPHVYEKVKQELDEKLGDKTFVSYEDIMKLEYLMLVLKETMRLFPPVQGTSRILGFDVQYEQYHLPKGTQVMVNTNQAMGMMDCYFDDPEEFRPERFRRDNDERMKSMYAYIPFSLGNRSCPGQQFAYIESRVILAKLLRRFDFRLVPGQRFTSGTSHLTQRPKDGCLTYISQLCSDHQTPIAIEALTFYAPTPSTCPRVDTTLHGYEEHRSHAEYAPCKSSRSRCGDVYTLLFCREYFVTLRVFIFLSMLTAAFVANKVSQEIGVAHKPVQEPSSKVEPPLEIHLQQLMTFMHFGPDYVIHDNVDASKVSNQSWVTISIQMGTMPPPTSEEDSNVTQNPKLEKQRGKAND
ncbi:cytochrome P450 3A28-like [Diadema antillarum]|uniref:cytochrome P450 3A28-like n=1 Tax=Diadema antillarum TaxID=105358 RepID=UPI003A872331